MNKHHQILGIKENASKNEIKKAYRNKAKDVHPDVNSSPEAQKLFIELAEAYDVLFNDKYVAPPKQKKKHWDNYTPPQSKEEYEEWKEVDKERKEYYKQKAREEHLRNKEKLNRSIKKFRKSMYYYPALLLYYFILFLFAACTIGSICVPIYIKWNAELYNFSNEIILLMGGCTITISFFLFKSIKELKKTMDPYFFDKR